MNQQPPAPRDEDVEHEWMLQEQALQAERLNLDARGDDALHRYRLVARALRRPLDENLPTDFACRTALQAHRHATSGMRLELWLSWAMLGVWIALLLVLMAVYGGAWLSLLRPALPLRAMTNPWLIALTVAVALPVALEQALRRKEA
ncbi:hypothetical protein ISP15_08870 [Dyella jejuensis]|uniref:DUF2868 domain-containing protein n=1 Tax=Dyella jejuensis TaxID=1432009 RepID=A0ABW8JJN4_9GAMM